LLPNLSREYDNRPILRTPYLDWFFSINFTERNNDLLKVKLMYVCIREKILDGFPLLSLFWVATAKGDLKMHLVRLCATSSSSSSVRSVLLPVLESLWRCSLARLCLPPSSSTNSRALVDLTSCDRFSFAHGWGFGSSARSDNSLHRFLGKTPVLRTRLLVKRRRRKPELFLYSG